MNEKPRIKMPKEARRGEIVQIKTLVAHLMESGQRKDQSGNVIPRKIINTFVCSFNGAPVFSCDLETSIAANPYLQFSVRVEQSGVFGFRWVDDDGTFVTAEEKIVVS
jgi:sulfur-oxidizing protein SoxZ